MNSMASFVRLCSGLLVTVVGCGVPDSDVKCGEGTVEERGECVPAATPGASTETEPETPTGGPAATTAETDSGEGAETTSTASTGSTSSGGFAGDSTGGGAFYGTCPGGSDTECSWDERCVEEFGMCAGECGNDFDLSLIHI